MAHLKCSTIVVDSRKQGNPILITKHKHWDSDWLKKKYPHRFTGDWFPDEAEVYDMKLIREGINVKEGGNYIHDYVPPPSIKKPVYVQTQLKL